MSTYNLPDELIERLKAVKGKRARIVVEHILKHGYITTEDLEKKYGYSHPPRAARDVREQGIPLETFRATSSDGRTIAAYRFGDLTQIEEGRLGGRTIFSKQFKDALYEESSGKCAICSGKFENRYLQIDHRIPYEIAGDDDPLERDTADYMLLCGSCNRAKSWSCEHCANWTAKSPSVCTHCYWAYPDNYTHVALREVRRLDILWDEDEVKTYEELKRIAEEQEVEIPDYVKRIIERHVGGPK